MPNEKTQVLKSTDSRIKNFTIRIARGNDGASTVAFNMSKNGHPATFLESSAGGLVLACVGHMYARKAKSFSVTESLGILAEDYSLAGVEGVRESIGGGMFSLFIVDKTRRKLFAMTDFLACMPLFFRDGSDGNLLGISQFDLAEGAAPTSLACAEYLTFGYLPFQPSLFEGVGRIAPGQVLCISLDSPGSHELSAQTLPSYPAPDQRISDEAEAIELVDSLFTGYFARLGDESAAAGLSGGYDSRLIAAYCKERRLSLVTFDNPHTNEVRNARRAAAVLGRTTNVFSIPPDAPSRFADDFYFGTETADSLESSHMFANLDALRESHPSYIIDGHIGDVVLGGGFYCKFKLRIEPFAKIVLGLDRYLSPPMPDDVYLSRMSSGYGRRIAGLREDVSAEVTSATQKGLLRLIGDYRQYCATDADLMELMLHRFRGSLLTSGGPVSFMRRNPTLSPFYDVGIFKACMGISKSLRAGDRLYNAFYRKRFPELAGIPKENTGGRANQGLFMYRMTHLKNAAARKLAGHLPGWIAKGGKAGGSIDSFQDQYIKDRTNQAFFDGILSDTGDWPGKSSLAMIGSPIDGDNAIMYLRRISLAFLLQGQR